MDQTTGRDIGSRTFGVVLAALVPEGTESVLEQVELVVPDDLGASLASLAPVELLGPTIGDLVHSADLGLAKNEQREIKNMSVDVVNVQLLWREGARTSDQQRIGNL